MIRLINATDLIKYNANARGNNTTDCVARGLSLAFNLQYDEILKELRATQKQMRSSSYKYTRVFAEVIKNHAPTSKLISIKPEDRVTVSEFVEQNVSSTIIILCGKSASSNDSTHLVTAIDGKLYDTWDSRNYYVFQYWIVDGIDHDFSFDINEYRETLRDQIYKDIDRFGLKYCQKYDIDPEEIGLRRTQWNENVLAVHLWWHSSKTDKKYNFSFNLSYSPTMTLEKAQKYTSDIIKTRLYDRFYTAVKEDKAVEEANKLFQESGESESNVWFSDERERKFFNSLPAKVRPFIDHLVVDRPGMYSDSVRVRMKLLPGDPRRGDPHYKYIWFEFYDCGTVRAMINRYLETWEHPNVDYYPAEEY